jgi:hypothetical protein
MASIFPKRFCSNILTHPGHYYFGFRLKLSGVYSAHGICYSSVMIQPEQLVGEEWAEWYRLTPVQRWLESEKLWQTYLALGGSLDPEPDTQSPFFDARAPRPRPAHGRAGVRVLRRGRV